MRYNYKTEGLDKDLEYDIARTIAAFMNTDGGVLIIGVGDKPRKLLGIEKDFTTLKKRKQDRDGFLNFLYEILSKYLNIPILSLIEVRFDKVALREFCKIKASKSPGPVFIQRFGKNEFHIRSGNRTQKLDPKDFFEYLKSHWDKL